MTTRRNILLSGALAGFGLTRSGHALVAPPALADEFSRIELVCGGRLGVAVLDTATRALTGLHADDRFPMCSTFKLLASAAVLQKVDRGREKLERLIAVESADVVPDSSFIKGPVSGGMTLAELCQAAMTYSDNTAGNLILSSIGGPQGVTAFARSIGDNVTRLDRDEPTLNEAMPGDPRDTTSPAAMLENIEKLVLGDVLSMSSKEQLTKWLDGNKTGDARLRAGLPKDWRCGDKTGSGEHGTTNDVGVVWPPNGKPIVVTVYLTETSAPPEKRNATLAAIGRAIVASHG
jgi:beta-lactamase class A